MTFPQASTIPRALGFMVCVLTTGCVGNSASTPAANPPVSGQEDAPSETPSAEEQFRTAIWHDLGDVSVTPSAAESLDLLVSQAARTIDQMPEGERATGLSAACDALEKVSQELRKDATPAEGMSKQDLVVGSPEVAQTLSRLCPVWPICD